MGEETRTVHVFGEGLLGSIAVMMAAFVSWSEGVGKGAMSCDWLQGGRKSRVIRLIRSR